MEKQTHGYYYFTDSTLLDRSLYLTMFEPENKPVVATLLILHGMQEHCGRYAALSQFLAERGIAVLAYDQIGHGLTMRNKHGYGFFHDADPVGQVILDAEMMAVYLEEKYAGIPHFVLGHSMGSFVARCLLKRNNERFTGAILTGTGGKVIGSGVVKGIFSWLNLFSDQTRSKLINNAFQKMNNRRFKNEPDADGTNWLSASKTNREAFAQDDLCGLPFSHNGFYALLSLNVEATRRRWAKNIRKEFPMLLLSGENDPIGDFGKGVRKTVEQLRNDGFKNITLELYPGMRHEILNEDIANEVFAVIEEWIRRLI
jgi:alpha-beta hydrolase superfamily lysophospholipase